MSSGHSSVTESGRGPDPRERIAGPIFRLVGPLVRREIATAVSAGPNVLLTVRGRSTGRPRTTPVAMLELGGVRYLQGSFGITNWVRNLRAAGEASVSRGAWSETFDVVEPPEAAGPMLRDALAPFHRSRVLRTLLGPTVRPPAAILYRYHFRIDDTLEEYLAEARCHPLFELRTKEATRAPVR